MVVIDTTQEFPTLPFIFTVDKEIIIIKYIYTHIYIWIYICIFIYMRKIIYMNIYVCIIIYIREMGTPNSIPLIHWRYQIYKYKYKYENI